MASGPEEDKNMSEIIHFCWLHISDMHFGHGSHSVKWDQKLILNKIISDMESRLEKNLPDPNAIIVTGDIASTGGCETTHNSSEYNDAKNWLAVLCDKTNLKNENIYLVPGNHDLQRSIISNRKTSRLLRELKEQEDNIDNAFADTDDREILLSLFDNYRLFSESYGPKRVVERNNTFWHEKVKLNENLTLIIVALNTAFLATENNDSGKLQLGNEQLKYILEIKKDNQIVIILSHHPFEWLSDHENVSRWVTNNGHIHLCGHIHGASSESLRKGGGASFIKVVSGASHSGDDVVGHGYSLGAIISKNDEMFLRVWPRKWSAQNKDFRVDVDNVPEGKCYVDHKIGLNYRTPSPKLVTENIEIENTQIPIKFTRNSDPIPAVNGWVGRENELKQFEDDTVKVFAITGIGGQGKSFLATRYIELLPLGTFWDWRDCREESDTLQTHILNIIERITNGKVLAYSFREETIEVIIDYFFKLIENFPGIFVFDNVDHYIDVGSNKATLGVNVLIDYALKRRHKSKFIFTSRPEVIYSDSSFFQIILPGMNIDETISLFKMRGIDIADAKNKEAACRVMDLTNGHPMWLNVIALQVSKNNKNLSSVIKELEDGVSADLDNTMMKSIWKTLNANQKLVLRCMAETVRPESHDRISDYLALRIKWNRVSQALKSLKSLNLIVVKKSPNAKDTLELHPIVKTYIRKEFFKADRITYIDMISSFFDSYIKKNSKHLKECASFRVLENWTLRAELSINAGMYKDALKILDEVSDALINAGHAEEYLRVSAKLLQNIDFEEAILEEYKHFDDVVADYVQALAHLGRYDDAETILQRYEKIIGKTARYINLCNMKCYLYWWCGEYGDAKKWGRTGIDMKKNFNIDTNFDCSNYYALAQRDSGDVAEALIYFLQNYSLEVVLNTSELLSDKTGEFYGNIGRCLFLQGNIKDALICYKKAMKLLEKKKSALSGINLGWGYFWIGEALEKITDCKLAYSFYCKASKVWGAHSPSKVEKASVACERMNLDNCDAQNDIDNLENDTICNNYIFC